MTRQAIWKNGLQTIIIGMNTISTFPIPADSSPLSAESFAITSSDVEVHREDDDAWAAPSRKRNPPPPLPWRARWIWLDPVSHPNLQTAPISSRFPDGHRFAAAGFRKEFDFPNNIDSVRFRVSADRKYRLRVNGRLVGRGPTEPGGDYALNEPVSWWFHDDYDLTEFLHPGRNVVQAEVVSRTGVPADLSLGRCGFILQADAWRDGESETVLKTDETWLATTLEAFVGVDQYDASLEDDETWRPATEIVSTANLRPSPVPPPMEWELAPSVQLPMLRSDAPKLVDFGKIIAGFAAFECEAPSGVRLTIEYGETPDRFHHQETYVTGTGRRRFRSFRLNSFRHLRLTVSGGEFNLHHLVGVFSSYPVTNSGAFHCSDAQLDRFWTIGRHTNRICMQRYHLDSPLHQEELGCCGDYLIEAAINYCCFGETVLAAADLERIALMLRQSDYNMFHTSYMLCWVVMLKEYHLYSGDSPLVENLHPTMTALLERFKNWRGSNGLVTECPSFMFMDWLEHAGFKLHHPPCVIGQGYMTAFYHRALVEAAWLCDEIGEHYDAERFRVEAADVRDAFLQALWVPEKGLFKDGIPFVRHAPTSSQYLPEDRDIETFTPHVTIAAVVAGIVTGETAATVMRNALSAMRDLEPQPYFYHFVFQALEKTDLFETFGYDLLATWSRLDSGSSTWRENWDWGDFSHAWGGTPTIQLIRQTLGIRPTKPGCQRLLLAPKSGPLTFAEGTFPTPGGDVFFRWEKSSSGLDVNLRLPPGVEATLKWKGATHQFAAPADQHVEFAKNVVAIAPRLETSRAAIVSPLVPSGQGASKEGTKRC